MQVTEGHFEDYSGSHAGCLLPPFYQAQHYATRTKALKICLVTNEVVGPVNNGGIGTAFTTMAHTLAQSGHDVTILFSLGEVSRKVRAGKEHKQEFVKVPRKVIWGKRKP